MICHGLVDERKLGYNFCFCTVYSRLRGISTFTYATLCYERQSLPAQQHAVPPAPIVTRLLGAVEALR